MIAPTITHLSVTEYFLEDDNVFPNSDLPLMVYYNAFEQFHTAEKMIGVFAGNNWRNSWKDGIYNFHHYHSNTHEVLGIYSGSCRVLFGGEEGTEILLEKGDVVVIPAGTAHKCVQASETFGCVGAYPGGKKFDMNYGNDAERPGADDNILRVPLPLFDPVWGKDGVLLDHWAYRV